MKRVMRCFLQSSEKANNKHDLCLLIKQRHELDKKKAQRGAANTRWWSFDQSDCSSLECHLYFQSLRRKRFESNSTHHYLPPQCEIYNDRKRLHSTVFSLQITSIVKDLTGEEGSERTINCSSGYTFSVFVLPDQMIETPTLDFSTNTRWIRFWYIRKREGLDWLHLRGV